MTHRLIAPILPFVLLSTLASAAPAQTPPPPAGSMGDGMDPPSTAGEVSAWADRLFAHLDANQDASITGAELAVLAGPGIAARGGSRLRAMIAQSDANRDARISAEELAAGAERMFARMDRNADGRLADDERPRPPAPPAPLTLPPPAPTLPTFPDMPPDGR